VSGEQFVQSGTSETIGKLAEALAKAQSVMRHAVKDAVNPHFKNRYADLAGIIDACRGPLSDNGLSFVQLPQYVDGCVGVRTILMHTSGEFVWSELFLPMAQKTPQGAGSALTYARRYSLSAVVGIAQDDDDGADASQRGEPEPARKPPGYLVTLRKQMTRHGLTTAWAASALGRDDLHDKPPTQEEARDLMREIEEIERAGKERNDAA